MADVSAGRDGSQAAVMAEVFSAHARCRAFAQDSVLFRV
jgi:hypothetical protein